MATTAGGDGMTFHESRGAGKKLRKRPIQTENATTIMDHGGNFAANGVSELKQMAKQMIVTRFKTLHPTTMEDLPDEILVNILVRLFAKQLGQMRSVSKSWNTLLSHPFCVKSHLHRSIHNNHQALLVFSNDFEKIKQYSCQSSHLETTNFIQHIPSNLPKRVIGSVNGLICLSQVYNTDIHIWNPSLSAISTIPQPDSEFIVGYLCGTFIRFGYYPKTDDYKLVLLTDLRGVPDFLTSAKDTLQVEIYSMRKGTWDLFTTQPFPPHVKRIHNTDTLCVDGHDGYLHWQIETVKKTKETILAFDLGSETFREIPLPDSILDSNHKRHVLGVLEGKLCEMSWRMDDECELWVMKEYGVPESWVKGHVFNFYICFYGFTSRNKLVFKDKYGRLALYDPIANETKVTRTEQCAFTIVDYVDSLVWI